MAVKPQGQTTIDERPIDDPALLKALNERLSAQEKKSAAVGVFTKADEHAKRLLEDQTLELDIPYRCGQFVITKKKTQPRAVSFETEPGEKLAISIDQAD